MTIPPRDRTSVPTATAGRAPSGDPGHLAREVPRGRLQRQSRKQGSYWSLVWGSGDARGSLTLGFVSDDEASRYLAGWEWLRLWFNYAASPFQVRHGLDPTLFVLDDDGRQEPLHVPHPDERGVPQWLKVVRVDDVVLQARRLKGTHGRQRMNELKRWIWDCGGVQGAEKMVQGSIVQPDVSIALEPSVLSPAARGYLPLRDFVRMYWEPVRRAQNEESWRRENGHWTRYLLPALGDIKIRSLTAQDFDKFIRTVKGVRGGSLSGNSKRLIKEAYKSCLLDAEREGAILQVHKFYRLRGTTKPVLETPRPFTLEEVARIIEAGATVGERALLCFAFHTGCRPAEVCGLRWEHVDWHADDDHLHGRVYIAGTKTDKSADTLALTSQCRALLAELHLRAGCQDRGAVFLWRGKQRKSYRELLRRAVKAAGLDDGRRIFQNLTRHTTGTIIAASQGKDAAAALLRHTSPKMVDEHYGHVPVARKVDLQVVFGGATSG